MDDEREIKENQCPECGEKGLKYEKPFNVAGMGQIGFPFKCKSCGTSGFEIHRIVFKGYNLDDPKDPACTIHKRSADMMYNEGKIHARHVLCKHIATINEPSLSRKYHVIVFTQEETGCSWTYTTTTSKPSGLDVQVGTYYNLIGRVADDGTGRFTELSVYTEKVDVMKTTGEIYMRPAEGEDTEPVHKRNGLDILLDMN